MNSEWRVICTAADAAETGEVACEPSVPRPHPPGETAINVTASGRAYASAQVRRAQSVQRSKSFHGASQQREDRKRAPLPASDEPAMPTTAITVCLSFMWTLAVTWCMAP